MKKFKRSIALLVAVMFLLSLAAPVSAATFSDLSGSTSGKDIYRLNALGIINGYPDGSFKPGNNITRAEFAVIAMSAAGLKNSADVLKNSPSKFKDVKSGEWYTGWANLAASQGFINGYPDGTFRPNNNITYAEVITILVRILGYNEKLPGTWPTEYIVKAGELGITDDVNFANSGLATRGDVAVLTSATLDEEIVNYDKDKEDFVSKYTPAKTLFAQKFDGYTYDEDGLVVTAWGMDSDNQYTMTVKSLVYEDPLDLSTMTGTRQFTLAKNVVINGANTVPDLKGQMVEINYNTDDREVTYVNATSKAVKAQNDSDSALDTIKDPTASNIELNGTSYSYADGYDAPITTYDNGDGYYKFYLNADGEIYDVSKYSSAKNYQVVDEYNTTTQKLSFKNSIGTGVATVELKDQDVVIVKDGKVAKAEDIKENDLVIVDTAISGLDYYLDVKSVSATGKVEALYGSADPYAAIKIGGKKLALRANALISTDAGENYSVITSANLDDVDGVDVKYFVDTQNKVAAIVSDKEATDNTLYGILTEVTDETLKGEVTKVKVLKPDNVVAEYSINLDDLVVAWDDTSPDPSSPDVTLAGSDGDWQIKYTLDSNGKIDDITVLDTDASRVDLDSAVKNTNKIITSTGASFYLDSNTKILNGRGAEDAAVETNNDLLSYLEDGTGTLDVWMKTDGNKVKYILLNQDLGVTSEDFALVVDKYKKDGKVWIDVDVRGKVTAYESSDQTSAFYDNLQVDDTDALYTYTMSGTKLDIALGTDEYANTLVAAEVYEKDTTNKSIRVGTNKWYEIDKDTYIYDLTGPEPKYLSDFADISVGDHVELYVLTATDDDDRAGVVDVLFITE